MNKSYKLERFRRRF